MKKISTNVSTNKGKPELRYRTCMENVIITTRIWCSLRPGDDSNNEGKFEVIIDQTNEVLLKKLIKFLISFFETDKFVTIHKIKNGNYKWYLYVNGKLQTISHPVQGYDTIDECRKVDPHDLPL